MPFVARLCVTPVKAFALHHPAEVTVEVSGIRANQRFYFVADDGRIGNGLFHGPLVQLWASWDEANERLTIRFPDGREVRGVVEFDGAELTDFYRSRVVHGRVVVGPWSGAVSEWVGKPVRLVMSDRPGDACDVHALTLVSNESVDELGRHGGQADLDSRRFRMNIEIKGCARPHEEDEWVGRRVQVGEAVLRVLETVARCAITTQDPNTGMRDFDALKTIIAYRSVPRGGKPCFGVRGDVERPGRVRVGDEVIVLD